jgi:hypothetical protein
MYQVVLFIHIVGVMCLMGGHTLLHVGLGRMRHAPQRVDLSPSMPRTSVHEND